MTEIEKIIAEAAALPLNDAAYALWREKSRLDSLELPPMTPEQRAIAMAKPIAEISAEIRYERDHAEDGRTFGRLKRAHPEAEDAEAKQAIVAAVRFDDCCFRCFDLAQGDFSERIERAVALAARDHPGYLEQTYRLARYHVGYHMK